MKIEKQKIFLIRTAFILVIAILVYFGVKYVIPLLMPFIFGFVVAFLLKPLIDNITDKTHLNRNLISVIVLITIISIIAALAVTFGLNLFSFLEDIFSKLPDFYSNQLQPLLNETIEKFFTRFPDLNLDWDKVSSSIDSSLSSSISTISKYAIGLITGIAGQLPSIIIKLLFTIVSTFFFTIDYHKIANFLMKQFSLERRNTILKVKENGVGTVIKFLKAYVTLILITFVELSIGFTLLGLPNSILIGAVIALIDILPILGTGAILLPWAGITYLFGNNLMAMELIILYVIITIVRQTLEPRIIGKQIGLHPIITLICMYVGAQLFGIIGLFLLPITATIIKQMNEEGTIKLFKY